MGSLKSHRAFVARLAQACKVRALFVAYRLAPEHPFPAALEDAVTAYKWLQENDVAPQHILVAGDSSGGGLTLALAITLRDQDEPLPAALICLSPLTDAAATGETHQSNAKADPWLRPEAISILRHYIARQNPNHPLISPLYADVHGLPPICIHVGQDEILLSDSTRFAERARAAGIDVTLRVWQGMWHVFPGFAPFVPEAGAAINEIGEFVSKVLSRQRAAEPAVSRPSQIEGDR
jgi:acetyl esterase/lipase